VQIARPPGRRQAPSNILVSNYLEDEELEDLNSKRLHKLKGLRDDWERSTNRKIQANEIRRKVQGILAENELALDARRARYVPRFKLPVMGKSQIKAYLQISSSNRPMIDIQTTNITVLLSVFYYYHYHHRYHYFYHNFIITIFCYAPSVITCTVGGAIQMTVYIYIYI